MNREPDKVKELWQAYRAESTESSNKTCQIEVDCEVRWCKVRKNKGAGLLRSDKCGKRALILSDGKKRPA